MPSTRIRTETLLDPEHPAIQRIHRLQSREERDRTGLFFTEGVRFVAQADEAGAALETLVYAPDLLLHPPARGLVRDARRWGIPCLEVSVPVFHSLSLAESPQGIGAVVRQHWETLRQIRPSGTLCWVCHERVQSPGNLGTIVRTCDAVGAAGTILLGGETDPFDPACVRATMGSLFSHRFVRASPAEFAAWKGRHRCLLVGTSPAGTRDYRAVSYRRPVVLCMGWERQGMSPEQQALCDVIVRIPMVGRADSLNVAVATGVLLYEVYNQRNRAGARGRGSGQ